MRVIYCTLLAGLLVACASTQPSLRDIRTLSAVETYETLCASCHGAGGEGDGPVASLIKVPVPDLTRIAQRAGGEFPTEDVRLTIDGRWDRRAHGARDMPVWGWQFYDSYNLEDADERAKVDATIDKLVVYLRSIQKE
jgi:hypothetical protein